VFNNKIVFISGGTGTFGSSIILKLLKTNIKEIRIFSRDEKKQDDMRGELNDLRLKFYIGDVRDYVGVNNALKGSDYVLHLSALKQIPSCEIFPLEAIKTNILGSENVLNACIHNNVKKVVVLSTDKAVLAITAMGLTKALMEKLMLAKARENTSVIFCATRFGNVIASRGSVVPKFINQIKNNKSLIVTGKNMSRFLMSVDESINLVLYALKYGNRGDIFIQKSPACKIIDLALALKEIFNSNVDIKITNPRHSEKIFETLISKEEMCRAEEKDNYFRIKLDDRDLNYNNECEDHDFKFEEYNSINTKQLSIEEIKEMLLKLDYIKEQLKC
jgi:UDP-glucose 4-epimerase